MARVEDSLAKRMEELLNELPADEREPAMKEVQEVLVEQGLWGYEDARMDPDQTWVFAMDVILENPVIGDYLNLVEPTALENLDQYESPLELAHGMTFLQSFGGFSEPIGAASSAKSGPVREPEGVGTGLDSERGKDVGLELTSDEDIGKIFDEELEAAFADETSALASAPAPGPSPEPTPKPAGEATKSAATETVMGMDEAARRLAKLFGSG